MAPEARTPSMRGFGWVSDSPDKRNHAYAFSHAVLERLPKRKDMRNGCPSAYDQKGLKLCGERRHDVVRRTGRLEMPLPGERLLGKHAVMAVGYEDTEERFIVRNSWGPRFGRKGYFTMPYDYLLKEDFSNDFWTIRVAN